MTIVSVVVDNLRPLKYRIDTSVNLKGNSFVIWSIVPSHIEVVS